MKWPVIDSLSIHPHILNGLIAVYAYGKEPCVLKQIKWLNQVVKKPLESSIIYQHKMYFLAVPQSDLAFKGRVVFLSRVLSIFVSRVEVQVAALTDVSQSTEENLKTTQEHFITHSLSTKIVLPRAASQSTLDISSKKKEGAFAEALSSTAN